MLNQRQRALLALLVQSGDFEPVRDLARRFGISPRGLRYDLEAVADYLSREGIVLERHKARGVRAVVPTAERDAWLRRLQSQGTEVYHLSQAERVGAILAVLLKGGGLVSANRLAAELAVSRRTLVDDLRQAEAWLAGRGLRLERTSRGLRVQGKEPDWRRAMAELFAAAAAAADAGEMPRVPACFQPLELQPLGAAEMDGIRRTTREVLRQLPFDLADVAVEGLVFHIAVAVQRLRLGHDIAMADADLRRLANTPEFQVAHSLCRRLEPQLGIRFPRAECGYITLHLLGAKAAGYPSEPEALARMEEAELAPLVRAFVRAAGSRLGYDLTGDADLYRGLLVHLRPALYRLRYGLPVFNPLREEIEERYGDLLEAVQCAARLLENSLGVEIPPDELAFLAMHVGASLERDPPARPRPRALVVCGSGVGTARLVQTRLRRAFPDLEVVDVIPLSRLEEVQSRTSFDLIVSTLPLPAAVGPAVVVNPFLTPDDVARIRRLIPDGKKLPTEERMRGPVLAEVLDEHTIALDVHAVDWEAAVRAAGNLLVRAEKVLPSYVDAMVEMVQRTGPYIVIDRGVAMPHARPEDGVQRIGFSLLRLAEPVPFGHAQNDPVRLVICLASPDAETHLRALRQLAGLLSNHQSRRILETGSTADILDLVRRAEDPRQG